MLMKIKPLLLHPKQRELLYPESHSRRSLPLNIEAADLGLFRHELYKDIPGTALLQFERCRVTGSGMLFRGVRIFEESFGYRSMLDEWASIRNVLRFLVRNYALRELRTCDENAVLFTDTWSGAYFHWITDALTRLYALGARAKGATILVPLAYAQLEYTLSSLAPFNIGAIRYLNKNQVLLCQRLMVPTHTAPSGHYNASVLRGLRDLLIDHFRGRDPIRGNERVYISRRKARVRRVVNEAEVEAVLEQYGFKTTCFEDFAFAEQLAFASTARYIVSNHGAGLTNMLFMPAGGSVLELRKAGDSHNNCYFSLASSLGLRYFYQLCDTKDPTEDVFSADLLVDTGRLKTNISLMLAG